jgi:hypothetical protein
MRGRSVEEVGKVRAGGRRRRAQGIRKRRESIRE